MPKIINNISGLELQSLLGLAEITESSLANNNVAEALAETADGGCLVYDACCTGDAFCAVIDCGCKDPQ